MTINFNKSTVNLMPDSELPDFMRPPPRKILELEESEKGLIVSAPIKIDGSSMQMNGNHLDQQELRFSLLFWDKLVWPTSRVFHFPHSHDETELMKAGILYRPNFEVSGDMAQGIAKIQIDAFLEQDQVHPGAWALAQGENSLLLQNHVFKPGNGALFELQRAIPVPRTDVPINDILEFKDRRQDELFKLRDKLNSLFLELNNSDDYNATLNANISEIDKCCVDLLKVSSEWKFPVVLSSAKMSFELRPTSIISGFEKGFTAANDLGMSLSEQFCMGLFGAIGSSVKISADVIGWQGFRRPTSPFRYVAQYHKEIF